jgi:hypothetical protein
VKNIKNVVKRIAISLLWFIPIAMVVGAAVGMFVGGFAGSTVTGFNEGAAAGANATKSFMQQYGQIVFFGEVIIWFVLCFFGILPGTGKSKKDPVPAS